MTADEKQKICDNIFQYITKKLDDCPSNHLIFLLYIEKYVIIFFNI